MQGYVRPDFAEVAVALGKTLVHKRGGGGAAAVYLRGEKVVDIWAGTRDADGRKWEQDTTAMSWSTSKGVVATAAHRLADQGLLDVDAPVGEYWPEFKAAGKEDIRVANLLDHSAGMHRVRGVIDDAAMLLDWDRTTAALAAAEPAYAAGTLHGYHALTYGYLVGEVLRRVTGLTVDEVVQREIVQPLGLTGMSIGARGPAFGQVATLLTSWPDPNKTERVVQRLDRFRRLRMPIDAFLLDGMAEILEDQSIYNADVPAINGCFTARSLARMYSVLATDEQIDGASFISPSTLRRATAVRTTKRDAIIGFPMRWRLGYHMAATNRGVLANGFGHFGLGGSGAWADPSRQLAVAMVCNRMAGTPFGDQRLLKVGGAAVRCAERASLSRPPAPAGSRAPPSLPPSELMTGGSMLVGSRIGGVVALGAVLVLGACASEAAGTAEKRARVNQDRPNSAPGAKVADPVTIPAAKSGGCDASAASVTAGTTKQDITSGGDARWYQRNVPPAHNATTPVPLVLDLHGYSEGAAVHLMMSGLEKFGDGKGFVTAHAAGHRPGAALGYREGIQGPRVPR